MPQRHENGFFRPTVRDIYAELSSYDPDKRDNKARIALEQHPMFIDPRGYGLPPGDGHPVVCIQGVNETTHHMDWKIDFLTRLGYSAHNNGMEPGEKIQLGSLRHVMTRTSERVRDLADTFDKPVSIYGHSLGGTIAARVASENPEMVRQLIFAGVPDFNRYSTTFPALWATTLWGSLQYPEFYRTIRRLDRHPAQTPTLHMNGTKDMIVQDRPRRHPRENEMWVDIETGHEGLLWHPGAYEAAAYALPLYGSVPETPQTLFTRSGN